MQLVCPLCNSIQDITVKCECGSEMINKGPLVDYLDDYSPYLSNDITQLVDGASHNECMHLFYCNNCSKDKRVAVKKILL
ncbi:hypothetical protein [Abyssisolibacter fermentans]|uniref:hypothetical protein n=1 Tax=Abyssisolibacter fermentans TaxID=1766203 RepID=UPI000834E6BA|nr:hypothetical protein [Abyssisolibacter fermentans]